MCPSAPQLHEMALCTQLPRVLNGLIGSRVNQLYLLDTQSPCRVDTEIASRLASAAGKPEISEMSFR
jgi:hypothetical protein